MRNALKNAVQSAILLECQLPHQETGIDKSCLSSQNDICFKHSSPQDVAKVIYNGIVEFAVNEFEMPKILLVVQGVSNNITPEELLT